MFKEYDKNTYKEKEIKDRTPFKTELKKTWNNVKFWRGVVLFIFIMLHLLSYSSKSYAAEILEETIQENVTSEETIETTEETDEIQEETILTSPKTAVLTDEGSVSNSTNEILTYLDTICLCVQSIYSILAIMLFFIVAKWTVEKIKNIVRRFNKYE